MEASRKIQREMKLGTWKVMSRLRAGNDCYHSVQNLLSYRLLPKKLKINIYRTIVLLVVSYGSLK